MLKSIRYVVYLSICLLLHIIFFSFVSLSFILAKRLIRLENITREFWKFDSSEIYCFNLEVHAFRYPRGYENEGFGGVCESEIGNPLASVEMSLAPN